MKYGCPIMVSSSAISLLGTKIRVFLEIYFLIFPYSLAYQGYNGHSGHIQLFGNGYSSGPLSGSFLIAFRFTPHALRVFPLFGSGSSGLEVRDISLRNESYGSP